MPSVCSHKKTCSYFSAHSSWVGGRAGESAGCGEGEREPPGEQRPCEPLPVGVPSTSGCGKSLLGLLTLVLMLLWAVFHNLGYFIFS